MTDNTGTRRFTDLEPMADSEEAALDELRAGSSPDPETERAQPGDVIGIETEGEITELGDTAEDEDERRREAEKQADDDRYKDL